MFVTFSVISKEANLPTYVWYFSRVYLYSFVSLFIYVVLNLFIAVILDTYEIIKVLAGHVGRVATVYVRVLAVYRHVTPCLPVAPVTSLTYVA